MCAFHDAFNAIKQVGVAKLLQSHFKISFLLVAIFAIFGVGVDTIGNKFGGVPHFLPAPKLPEFDIHTALSVMPSAFTIAFLAGIVSM